MVIDETELEGLTEDQRDAYIALKEGRNVFLSGNAGTGKSYVLNRFIDDLEARSVPYTAMAPTGIAALNMHNGSTIHRTLQVSAGVCNPSEKIRPRKVLTVAEVIIIDEISMCRIDLFDYVMRMISDAQVSSGRKQVVLVGDFFQLPPVITEDDRAILMKLYPGNFEGWAFESDYWDGFDFEPHILKKVVRQDDPEYIGNLNLARNGDESCIPYFNEHSVSDRKYAPKDALFLCSNNRLASNINTESVSELSGKKYTYQASATGKVNKGDRAADDKITLCAGARVMSLVNDPEGKYVNGSQGTVVKCTKTSVTDAGADLRADIPEPVTLQPRESTFFNTGIEVAIPEGYFGALAIRSSLACKHGLMLANSLGIIDSCYRGPVKAKLVNIGRRPYTINPGDRIAQLLIIPCVHAAFIQVDELPESDRGTGGFGSTGAQ